MMQVQVMIMIIQTTMQVKVMIMHTIMTTIIFSNYIEIDSEGKPSYGDNLEMIIAPMMKLVQTSLLHLTSLLSTLQPDIHAFTI